MINEIKVGSILKAKQPPVIVKRISEFVKFNEAIGKSIEIELGLGIKVVGLGGGRFLEVAFESPDIPDIFIPIEMGDVTEFFGRIILSDFEFILEEWTSCALPQPAKQSHGVMISKIKEKLEAGEDAYISLTDPNGFRDKAGRAEYLIQDMLNSVRLQVLEFGVGFGRRIMVRLLNPVYEALIYEEDLKFFDIVDDCPTFNDLVDVATKAVEDGVLFSVGLFEDSIFIYLSHASYHTNRPSFSVSRDDDIAKMPNIIEKIDSLYIESFEIEDISCLLKINENIQSLVLANGCDVIDQIYFEDCGMHLKDGYGNSIVPNINILKGATVTQKKVDN